MKAGGLVESGLQTCHNKYLAVNLANNLGFQGLSEGFTGVLQGFFKRALKPYIAPTNSLATPAQAYHIQECEMNGWQRLWVVMCVLVGISLMLIGEMFVPTQESITQKFEKPLALEHKFLNEIQQKNFSQDPFNETFFGSTALHDTEARIFDLESRQQHEMSSLWGDQLKIRGIIASAWLVICVALYLCGSVIGWVYRGFKSS